VPDCGLPHIDANGFVNDNANLSADANDYVCVDVHVYVIVNANGNVNGNANAHGVVYVDISANFSANDIGNAHTNGNTNVHPCPDRHEHLPALPHPHSGRAIGSACRRVSRVAD
jgi:hypothetical protein